MQDSPNCAAIKKEGGGQVLCFSNSCYFDCLLAVSLDNLPATETNPIGRSAPVRSKRETRAFIEVEGELWDGWRKRAGGGGWGRVGSCQASVPQEKRKSYVAHPKLRRQARKWTLLLLIKGDVVLCHLALRGVSAAKGMFKTAAHFLRIFPPAPCFFLMASGVH